VGKVGAALRKHRSGVKGFPSRRPHIDHRFNYLQPQLVPLAPQHALFAAGAQHEAWVVGEQQAAASAGCCVVIGMPLGEGADGCLVAVVGWLGFITQLLVSLFVGSPIERLTYRDAEAAKKTQLIYQACAAGRCCASLC
jgi:hypothetical protein